MLTINSGKSITFKFCEYPSFKMYVNDFLYKRTRAKQQTENDKRLSLYSYKSNISHIPIHKLKYRKLLYRTYFLKSAFNITFKVSRTWTLVILIVLSSAGDRFKMLQHNRQRL